MTCAACTDDVDGIEVSPIQQRAVLRDLRRALVDPQIDAVVLARGVCGPDWTEGYNSAIECVDSLIEHLRGHIEGLAAAVAPVTRADPDHARATDPAAGGDLAALMDQRDRGVAIAERVPEVMAKLRAARAVRAEREAELLAIKGPCSDAGCTLHLAHRGPHTDRPIAAASEAVTEGGPVTSAEVIAWHQARFGEPDDALVGLKGAEEMGEVAGAIVKRAEGAVRPDKGMYCREDWTRHLLGEMGDVGVVLHTLAAREGTTLDDVIRRRFRDDVSQRTRQEQPATPREQGTVEAATEGEPIEVDGRLWYPRDCRCRAEGEQACPIPVVHFAPRVAATPRAEGQAAAGNVELTVRAVLQSYGFRATEQSVGDLLDDTMRHLGAMTVADRQHNDSTRAADEKIGASWVPLAQMVAGALPRRDWVVATNVALALELAGVSVPGAPPAPEVVSGAEAAAGETLLGARAARLPVGSLVHIEGSASVENQRWRTGGRWRCDDGGFIDLDPSVPYVVLHRVVERDAPPLAVGDVVETAADLDRLADESVIRDADDILFVKLGPLDDDPDPWAMPGGEGRYRPSLPAMVRDVPTGGDRS